MTSAEYLRDLAGHFAPRDWLWTRETHLEAIYNTDDHDRRPWYRLRKFARAVRDDFITGQKGIYRELYGYRWAWFHSPLRHLRADVAVHLRRDPNLPDGELIGASTLCYWEEDGEYIQMVQPSIGLLLAEFLIAEPDHPHAKKITAELDRIGAQYRERIKAGEV